MKTRGIGYLVQDDSVPQIVRYPVGFGLVNVPKSAPPAVHRPALRLGEKALVRSLGGDRFRQIVGFESRHRREAFRPRYIPGGQLSVFQKSPDGSFFGPVKSASRRFRSHYLNRKPRVLRPSLKREAHLHEHCVPVSYTHLTLPTNREV